MKSEIALSILLLATVLAALPAAEKAQFIVEPEIFIHHTPERSFIGPGMFVLENGDLLMAAPWGRPPTNFEQLAAKFPVPMLYRSTDGGRTWKEQGRMKMEWKLTGMVSDGGVTFLRLKDGRLAALLPRHVQGQKGGGLPVITFSSDDGATWTPARLIGEAEGAWYVMNDRLIQLRSGRLLVPVAHMPQAPGLREGDRNQSLCFFSDDGGATWRRSREPAILDDARGLQEPCVAEVEGGRVLMLSRTGSGFLFASRSDDGGDTWSKPEPTTLVSACSSLTLKTLPDGRMIIFYNHAAPIKAGAFFPRTPLCYAVSGDGGKTWSAQVIVDDEGAANKDRQNIYPSACFTQEGIVVMWSTHGADPKGSFAGQYDANIGGGKRAILAMPAKALPKTAGKPDLVPVQLAASAKPADVDGKSYDLVVVGGTPGGIAMAVRAAREGLSVVLVNWHAHLGGIMSSGLGAWDTQYEGRRSPLYDETRAAFFAHYRNTYGEDSPQYRDALPGKTGHTNGRTEPHVAERVFTALVEKEKNITVLRGYVPASIERAGATVNSVTVRPMLGGGEKVLRGKVFADCTYEGDLAALAQVPYRVGRESREEFGEPHAGIVFMKPVPQAPDADFAILAELRDALNLRKFTGWQVRLPQSTGAADGAVQACNYRTPLVTDPANRVPSPQPANYEPYYLRSLEPYSGVPSIPNGKFGWNRPQLIGLQTPYVEADWPGRQRIMDQHWDMTLGLLYFLQNDPTVPEKVRAAWMEYGLAKDEFADNGHRPYEMYIREARRITGRTIFTQHDAMLAPGLGRAPVHSDSIATTEWYMDSHACTIVRVLGSMEEGKAMLHQETFPGQLPWRSLLPQGVDNLLVPVCLSATHVAWGTVRLEPVFMQVGESAGLAAALAVRGKTSPTQLSADRLVRELCIRRSMVSFFNDVNVDDLAEWVPAVQYFGTKGFFADYNARPAEPLSEAVRDAWQGGFDQLQKGTLDPMKLAATVHAAQSKDSPHTREQRADFLLRLWKQLNQR